MHHMWTFHVESVLSIVYVALLTEQCLLVAVVLVVVVACMWYATGGRPPTVARHCPRRECVSLVHVCYLSSPCMHARMCLFDRLLH